MGPQPGGSRCARKWSPNRACLPPPGHLVRTRVLSQQVRAEGGERVRFCFSNKTRRWFTAFEMDRSRALSLGPASLASPGSLLETQLFEPHCQVYRIRNLGGIEVSTSFKNIYLFIYGSVRS